jgi:hydroxymethylglutaryl-CoA lyase
MNFPSPVRIIEVGPRDYAQGVTGNVATEHLVYMLRGMGVATGIDLSRLIPTSIWIAEKLGRPITSHLAKTKASPA